MPGRFANKNAIHSVYVLKLQHGKWYVGMTPTYKLNSRMEDHMCNDPHRGARWTNIYRPIEKIKVYSGYSFVEAGLLEQIIVEKFMVAFGLDSVRGGSWNMTTLNKGWWVPKRLENIPRIINCTNELEMLKKLLPIQPKTAVPALVAP